MTSTANTDEKSKQQQKSKDSIRDQIKSAIDKQVTAENVNQLTLQLVRTMLAKDFSQECITSHKSFINDVLLLRVVSLM